METIKQITDHADQLFGGSSSTKEIVKEKKRESASKKNETEPSAPAGKNSSSDMIFRP